MAVLVVITAGSTYVLTADLADYDKIKTSGPLMTGNVKITQYDGDGNIVAYRQSFNNIVAGGMEMIMQQVFHDINTTAPFPVAGASGRVQFMEIGTGGENKLLYNDTDIFVDIPTCARQDAIIANVSSHKAPDDCKITDPSGLSCFARMNVTAMASFSGMQCSGALDIDEAGIFNDLAAGTMFARNTFGGVVLNPPDTLALDWEFTFTDS